MNAGRRFSWPRTGPIAAHNLLLQSLREWLTPSAGLSVGPVTDLLSPLGPNSYRSAMRPLISWSALTSASVGIWGLGVEGTASLRRLESMGLGSGPGRRPASPRHPPCGDLEVLATDAGGLQALLACDVVIKSPGISRYRPEVAQTRTRRDTGA